MDDNAVKSLASAVVLQAISDWRYLCKGGVETKSCNFEELTIFFERECDNYLTTGDITAEKILSMLKRERKSSQTNKSKRGA